MIYRKQVPNYDGVLWYLVARYFCILQGSMKVADGYNAMEEMRNASWMTASV